MHHPSVAQSLFVRKSARMTGYLLFSVAAHGAIIGAVVVLGLIHRPPPIDLNQKPIKASLVRLGQARDKRLLPRKEEPPAPPREVQAPAPIPKEPAPKAPSPAATVPAPSAKQEGKKEGDARKKLFGAFSKAGAKAEDLEGAEDGDPLGDSAVQEGERYYGALRGQVRRYYFVSETIPDQERIRLRAQVLFRIGRSGELLETKLLKSSGNALFDSAVLSAVKKAAPFGPPPPHLLDSLRAQGVLIEFTPTELSR
ncbi:MAG TPA: TonB family protein [Myxococcaceae bacterium]|nr:TonB family protein [Myxococcaceae bacterium]